MRNLFSLPTIALFLFAGATLAEEARIGHPLRFRGQGCARGVGESGAFPVKGAEPAVKLEQAAEHATSGKQSLRLTFAGGDWPTVTTTKVDDAWLRYQTFHADVLPPVPV